MCGRTIEEPLYESYEMYGVLAVVQRIKLARLRADHGVRFETDNPARKVWGKISRPPTRTKKAW